MIEIISQACRGLHAAHEMGLVHRDVKPSNIFVMEDNSVKIIDFGDRPRRLHELDDQPEGDALLHGAGATAAEAADAALRPVRAGRGLLRSADAPPPLPGRLPKPEMVDAILRQTPPPISDINPNVRFAISQVVHKAMAKQPLPPLPQRARVRRCADPGRCARRPSNISIRPRSSRAWSAPTPAFESGRLRVRQRGAHGAGKRRLPGAGNHAAAPPPGSVHAPGAGAPVAGERQPLRGGAGISRSPCARSRRRWRSTPRIPMRWR